MWGQGAAAAGMSTMMQTIIVTTHYSLESIQVSELARR